MQNLSKNRAIARPKGINIIVSLQKPTFQRAVQILR